MTTISVDPPMEETVAPTHRDTSVPRHVLLSVLSLACLLVGGVAAAASSDVTRSVSLTLFLMLGIGSALWTFNPHLTFVARVSLSFATSFAVMVGVSGFMVETGWWHPDVAFVVVGGAACLVHVFTLLRGLPEIAEQRRRAEWNPPWTGLSAGELTAAALVAVSLGVCLIAAVATKTADPGVGGFLRTISPAWYVGVAVCVALASGLVVRRNSARIQAAATCATGLIFTLTPAIAYGVPRSQSAEKHIALAQLIRTTGGLHSTYSVYNGWPGFFSAIAWISDVARIHDPISLATYWPALLVLFRVAALRYLASRFFDSAPIAWGATLLAVLADSLGGDYFSPQSIGFDLGLVLFAVVLSKRTGLARLALTLAIACTITFSHQLSPFIVGGVVVVLVIFRLVRPWWTPLLILVPAVGWALLHASTVSSFISLKSFGRTSNFQLPSARVPGQRELIVQLSIGAVVTAALVLGLLGLVTLVRQRRQRWVWAAACAPLVGVGAVTANSYGNEGIFRTVLFALPWLAILATPTVFAVRDSVAASTVRAVAVAVLAAAFLFGLYGLDGSGVARRADRDVLNQAENDARSNPQRKVLMVYLGPGDVPASGPTYPANYSAYTWTNFSVSTLTQAATPSDTVAFDSIVENLAGLAITQSRRPTGQADIYALSSPAQRIYGAEYGLVSSGQSQALLSAMQRSPYWQAETNRDGTFSFKLNATAYANRPR